MCSITDEARGVARGAALRALIGHAHEVADAIADQLAQPGVDADLDALHVDALAGQLRDLLASIDRSRAAATVLTGAVDRKVSARQLIEGTFASTRRFLEVEAGLSEQSAKSLTARAHDLRDSADDGDARVRDAWLAGKVSDDQVRVLTVGVRQAVKHVPIAQRPAATRAALDALLPIAVELGVADLARATAKLAFVLDPDGTTQAQLDAYTEQSLTCVPVGHVMRLQAYLDAETAAAVMTVLDQQVAAWRSEGDVAAEDALPDGVDPESAEGCRLLRGRTAHLRALALGETMAGLLDRGEVGTHHGVRPHLVLHVDAGDLRDGLGGRLTMPGQDEPVPVPSETVRRILCDSSLTHVVTQPARCHGDRHVTDDLPDLLREHAVEVLYVGREFRTAPPRLRRALEARDRHCTAPGCRRSPRRCNAHHVEHWERGGETSIANCLLLCERHHRALHAGELTITRDRTRRPTEPGYVRVHPPDRQPTP
jgi:hypothetical protein